MISTNDQKVNLSTTAGADVSTINEAVSQRIKQFRSQKRCRWMSLRGVPASVKECWWKLKAVKPIQALRCYVRSRRQWGVRGGFCQRRQRADGSSYQPGCYSGVVARRERRQCKTNGGTSGPDMLELWQWIMHHGEQFESAGHPADTCELLFVNQEH